MDAKEPFFTEEDFIEPSEIADWADPEGKLQQEQCAAIANAKVTPLLLELEELRLRRSFSWRAEREHRAGEEMTEAELKTLEELASKATPGPWEVHPNPRYYVLLPTEGQDDNRDANARFTSEARTAVPRLIERVRELEKQNGNAVTVPGPELKKMQLKLEELRLRSSKLEKALEYYAHKEHYEDHFHFDTGFRIPVLHDGGDLARAALEKSK